MQNEMIANVSALLADGKVDRVLGWKRGELGWDVSPAVFHTPRELQQEFVYDRYCGANLSKYLVAECRKGGRLAVFLKPCDRPAFELLVKEHRISREMCHVLEVPCSGSYSYDPEAEEDRLDIRCAACEHADAHPLHKQVEDIEAMTPAERFAFWQGELSRCIRCNACRNACPACTCESCVFDNPASGVAQKAATNSFEGNLFHIIRAFHVAGRCVDCGECSRVCPQHIPLHLLNRKLIKELRNAYGEDASLTAFCETDPEPSDVIGGGNRA